MPPVSVEYTSPEGNRSVAVLRLDDGKAYATTKHLLWDTELARISRGFDDEVVRFSDLFESRFPGDPRPSEPRPAA